MGNIYSIGNKAFIGQYHCKRPTGDFLVYTQCSSGKSYSQGQNTRSSRGETRIDFYIN